VYYCYILRCADGGYYYGSTTDLSRRVEEHRRGRVRVTRPRRPVQLVYYETFPTQLEAFRREHRFKNGRTRKTTRDRLIAEFPPENLTSFNR